MNKYIPNETGIMSVPMSNNGFIVAMNNVTYTENGALTNKSFMSKVIDFFFHGAAMRKEVLNDKGTLNFETKTINPTGHNRLIKMFQEAFDENPTQALRILFYIRDIRGGQGEREVFRAIINWIAHSNSTKAEDIQIWLKENIELIPEYGRWDDLFVFIGSTLHKKVVNFIAYQLGKDHSCAITKQPVSLLAKWMPSENASNRRTRTLAKIFIKELGFTPKRYRQVLSKIRNYINIVETNLTQKTYDHIDYNTVPSKAGLLYKKAFMKHDTERYSHYLEAVANGNANMNTSTLYPYDVLRKYLNDGMFGGSYYSCPEIDPTIELMWKNLPDYVPDLCGLVVADTSGSMQGNPMLVSISLAMYIAERNKNEAWKDYFISFSRQPKFHKIEGDNLFERAKSVALGDVANTNLQVVFDLILIRAISNGVPKEDMPKVLIIVSDMEFDKCTFNNTTTNFEKIKCTYNDYKYEMPTLIFWNVNSRNTQSPITINDDGVVLLSGCSPSVFKYALGNCKTPMDLVYNVTSSDRYNKINF